MKPEQDGKNVKVGFIRFGRRDCSDLIRQNLKVLESSHILVNPRESEVVVKDGSPASVRIRNSRAGEVVPAGNQTVDGTLYRFYLVSPDLLQSLQSAP